MPKPQEIYDGRAFNDDTQGVPGLLRLHGRQRNRRGTAEFELERHLDRKLGRWQRHADVFADNDLIAMYWDGDYLSDTQSSLSADGRVVTITWASGQAVLNRDGETSGHIVIHEKGKSDISFDLKRDNQ